MKTNKILIARVFMMPVVILYSLLVEALLFFPIFPIGGIVAFIGFMNMIFLPFKILLNYCGAGFCYDFGVFKCHKNDIVNDLCNSIIAITICLWIPFYIYYYWIKNGKFLDVIGEW